MGFFEEHLQYMGVQIEKKIPKTSELDFSFWMKKPTEKYWHLNGKRLSDLWDPLSEAIQTSSNFKI